MLFVFELIKQIEQEIIVIIEAMINWLAPILIATPISKNKYTICSGSLIAARNLTIDNAPTNPSDKIKDTFITEIIKNVDKPNKRNNLEKDLWFDTVLAHLL